MSGDAGPLSLPRLDPETRRRAIEEPGPSWSQWFYRSFSRVWTLLGFLILDSILIATWIQPFEPVFLFGTLIPALYLELLAYQYLWQKPNYDVLRRGAPFQRRWYRIVEFGRWTEEAERAKAGVVVRPGPDPTEFL